MTGLIKFQDVYRDAIQSLFGTNPSADEIIAAYQHAHETGAVSIQTGGGTFYDLFAKKGRDEWSEIEKIISSFKEKGIRQSALIRGDFLFTYEPQPYDVIRATVFEYAKMGMNVLQNFHGMNDARCLVGVAKAVQEAQAQGYDIIAQGAICIEDNPNITVEGCLEFAQQLVDMGHQGFYLKSASGRLDADFVYELTAALYDKFPDQPITIHAHSTYGEAPICYMAAAKAAIERGKEITMDVQHPAMSGSTAQPNMLKMLNLIKNHPDPSIRENAPRLNIAAIKKDMERLYEMRFRYGDSESTYNHELLEAMRPARVPGGASATLRGIPGLEANLARLLGTNDWDKIQIEIYKMQEKILDDLGQPTQVTPYAANTTGQAALSLVSELQGKDRYEVLYPGIVNYLVGRHGRVPDTVNKDLQAKALKAAGLEKPVDYILSTDREDALPAAAEALENVRLPYKMAPQNPWPSKKVELEQVIKQATTRQAISAVLLKGGVDHVVACHLGNNKPQAMPNLPQYAQVPLDENRHVTRHGVPIRDVRDAIHAIGGAAKLQEIAERALHLKQIDDGLYEFPMGEKDLEVQWRIGNLKKISSLLNDIPKLLEQAGFVPSQIMSISGEFRENNVVACIQKACDRKGQGLFEHMMSSVNEFRKHVLENGKVIDVNFKKEGGANVTSSASGTAVAAAAPRF
ncbi:MAG TPA: hypothetical protein PLF01_01415 [Alphaproteobacteria bacterium]|nr:hypothetical protein [Alphaproteobacteria bacterium]